MNSAQWREKMRDEYDPMEEARERAIEYMYSIAPQWCKGCERLHYNKWDELYCEHPDTDEIHYIDPRYDKAISCPIIKEQITCKQYSCKHIYIDEIDRIAGCENECRGVTMNRNLSRTCRELARAWSYDYDFNENMDDATVALLREYIEHYLSRKRNEEYGSACEPSNELS